MIVYSVFKEQAAFFLAVSKLYCFHDSFFMTSHGGFPTVARRIL